MPLPPGANVPREGGRVSRAPVIASAAKQSRASRKTMDCFVADAPRNDGELFEMLNP
jgi:hypothetical protein